MLLFSIVHWRKTVANIFVLLFSQPYQFSGLLRGENRMLDVFSQLKPQTDKRKSDPSSGAFAMHCSLKILLSKYIIVETNFQGVIPPGLLVKG